MGPFGFFARRTPAPDPMREHLEILADALTTPGKRPAALWHWDVMDEIAALPVTTDCPLIEMED